ncbi:hypothetical protein [Streptomyces albidochromogenes]
MRAPASRTPGYPSAVLRADEREAAYQGLVSGLRMAARALG